jgi:hypothetical protein
MTFVKKSPMKPTKKIPRTIYFTNADLTMRRPSGAILVIDRYEVGSISDGKTRFVLE